MTTKPADLSSVAAREAWAAVPEPLSTCTLTLEGASGGGAGVLGAGGWPLPRNWFTVWVPAGCCRRSTSAPPITAGAVGRV